MIKKIHSFQLFHKKKKKKIGDLLNFKYFVLELHKKILFISERSTKNVGKTSKPTRLFVKKKNRVRYKELIGQLNIREIKTR